MEKGEQLLLTADGRNHDIMYATRRHIYGGIYLGAATRNWSFRQEALWRRMSASLYRVGGGWSGDGREFSSLRDGQSGMVARHEALARRTGQFVRVTLVLSFMFALSCFPSLVLSLPLSLSLSPSVCLSVCHTFSQKQRFFNSPPTNK